MEQRDRIKVKSLLFDLVTGFTLSMHRQATYESCYRGVSHKMLDLSQHRVMTRAVFPNLLQRLIQLLKLTYTLTITSTMVNVSNAASYYQTKLYN